MRKSFRKSFNGGGGLLDPNNADGSSSKPPRKSVGGGEVWFNGTDEEMEIPATVASFRSRGSGGVNTLGVPRLSGMRSNRSSRRGSKRSFMKNTPGGNRKRSSAFSL